MNGITDQTIAANGNRAAIGDLQRCLGTEGHLAADRHTTGLREPHFIARSLAIDAKARCVRVAVADITAAAGQSLTPLGEVEFPDAAELHVGAALADTRAAHTRVVRFTRALQRQAAVHQVIPGVPLQQPRGVHRADEITGAMRGADKDFMTTGIGNRHVWQHIDHALMA